MKFSGESQISGLENNFKNRFYMTPLGNPVGSHITTTHKIGFEKNFYPLPRGMFRTLLKNSVYEEKRVLVFLDRVRNN